MIYTSYFGNWRNFPDDFKLIAICNDLPFWSKEYELCEFEEVRPFKMLVTSYKSGDITEDLYEEYYLQCLKDLNIEEFIRKYEKSILLCYEKPTFFCHRHLLRRFINNALGKEVIREL